MHGCFLIILRPPSAATRLSATRLAAPAVPSPSLGAVAALSPLTG